MNRSELIKTYHERRSGHSPEASALQVDLMVDIIKETLERGEKVTIHNLGTLSVVERGARTGRNPKTNEVINIPERKGIKFKPSRSLVDAVQ